LLKEKCLWHLDGNHTANQCYQIWRALKDIPEPRPPHDKKGKKKVDEGNDDIQEPHKKGIAGVGCGLTGVGAGEEQARKVIAGEASRCGEDK
jgi:hypothetical protein